MNGLRKRLIGSRQFYKTVLLITLPIIMQNALTSVVGFLDNIMVGRLGTDAINGIAISGSLLFVFQLAIFGAVSGAGIFGAQFYGKGDHKGVSEALRIKLYLSVVLTAVGILLFCFFMKDFVGLYLHDATSSVGSPEETLNQATKYLTIMLIGLPPMALSICYSSSMRECGETFVPMIAGIIAVLTDLFLNWVLIFGNLGLPALGVQGAAIATVISRFADCAINVTYTHTHKNKLKFAQYVLETFNVSGSLLKNVAIKGLPLMCNEIFWVLSVTVTGQLYSYRGLDVLAANNINTNIGNVFNIVFIALGSTVGILVGQQLGSGDTEGAHDTAYKMIFFSVASCFITSAVMLSVSGVIPNFYKTEPEVRQLASSLIKVYALGMPLMAFNHATYFAIRSGGKTFITLLFDSVYCWTVNVPLAFVLVHYTGLPFLSIYTLVVFSEIVKCVLATIFLRKLNWAVDLTQSIEN
ncbi:MAG: MATE family efflux transporter [Clostridia bacterium]|nr:MATE family efflux transporter [Clostridia bacterium]